MKIRFLHLNIEGRKHTDRIFAFLRNHEFDILCMQEVFLDTAVLISKNFGFEYVFVNLELKDSNESKGNAIFSKNGFVSKKEVLTIDFPKDCGWAYKTDKLLVVSIEKDKTLFNIATAHLPVNYPGNEISAIQLETFDRLKDELVKFDELFLTGDFNSPRGTIIFDSLANHFTDNVPKDEVSTLDPVLHRAGFLHYVVDGVFTTKGYRVTDVVVNTGLSDHKGISGILSLKENKV